MNTKHFFAGMGVATVLALSSPVYAGILGGGAGGGFGGGLNGGLSGLGGRNIGGAGSLGAQGQLDGSIKSPVKVKPVIDATKSTTQTAVDKTKDAAGNVVDTTKSAAQTTVDKTKDVAGNAVGTAAADAAATKADVGGSLAATGNSLTQPTASNAPSKASPNATPTKSPATTSSTASLSASGSLN